MKRTSIMISTLAGLTLAGATTAGAATTVVEPANMGSWAFVVGPADGVGDFVTGPATAPLGDGSAHLSTGTAGDLTTSVCDGSLDGTPLASLTALGFSTYATSAGADGKRGPFLALHLDNDGDTVADDTIYFEPAWQNHVDGNVALPDQGATALGTWQTWDALAGGWWSQNAVDGSAPGAGVKHVSEYLVVAPTATIVNDVDGACVSVGRGAASDSFDGNVDAVVVGLDGAEPTTYDFEPAPPDTDGDGVIDDVDVCPETDVSATTVVVGTCDSGVTNTVFPSGCSISDLVAACAENARNHGKFVSCVSHRMNALKKEGVLKKNQKGKIQRCAARSKTH